MEKQQKNNEQNEEAHIYSVSEINGAIKGQLESNFRLLWLKGEISNFTAHGSGHYYFSLKDKKSQVSAVMFKGFNSRLKFKPKSGMEVIVRGRVTVYEPRGNYQILCENMDAVGGGALQQAFEQLKEKLRLEGCFAADKKRPIPSLPQKVALVTSPTGAAVQDMLNVLHRRFRSVEVLIVPCLVQGKNAAPDIVAALAKVALCKDIDVVIVGRGGGSIEDLWAFNEEIVARAILNCPVPIISAVGHEVDFTIADFVADLRAPTPSAAAEVVARDSEEVLQAFISLHHRLVQKMRYKLEGDHKHVINVSKRLIDPQRQLQDLMQRTDELTVRIQQSMLRQLERFSKDLKSTGLRLKSPESLILKKREGVDLLLGRMNSVQKNYFALKKQRLSALMSMLDSLSPLKILERGYSVVRLKKSVINNVQQLSLGDEVDILLSEGGFKAKVTSTTKN